jgi:hypothetical protein
MSLTGLPNDSEMIGVHLQKISQMSFFRVMNLPEPQRLLPSTGKMYCTDRPIASTA